MKTVKRAARFCAVALLGVSAAMAEDSATSRSLPPALQEAVDMVEANDWDGAIPALRQLLDAGGLEPAAREQALKYLGLSYSFKENEAEAVAVFMTLMREFTDFQTDDLAMSYQDEPDPGAHRYMLQASYNLRQEQLEHRRRTLESTSASGALLRSLVLPGLGQRYQGYRGRSWAMMGLAGASVAYAVLADRSYRNAKDAYDNGELGADFPALWDDYSKKADTADLALGIVGAVWALNLFEVALSGPNLSGLESVAVTPTADGAGVQVAWRREF